MMDGWSMTGWGWGWMAIWTLAGIVFVAWLAAMLLRSTSPPPALAPLDSAMAVLRRRFAAGEIDEAEFKQRREELEASREEEAS